MAAPEFLAITGATTTGKTALSLAVAEALDGEVISMDSRQIYRGMDIGTDKVAGGIRARIPHHGVDIRDPNESYSAGAFARDAARWMNGIRARGRVPVLAGGTGFFLKALMEPLFEEPQLDPGRVARLRRFLAQRGDGGVGALGTRPGPGSGPARGRGRDAAHRAHPRSNSAHRPSALVVAPFGAGDGSRHRGDGRGAGSAAC